MKLAFRFGLFLLVLAAITNGYRITHEETKGLEQLRVQLSKVLYEPYMRTDFYLINFLRVKNGDISGAAEMIRKAQNWRIRQRMDNILNETYPWNELLKVLPYRTDGVDRVGRPILEVPAGKWDTRKFVISGKGDLYSHHASRALEDAFQKVRIANGNNQNITQWQFLYDMNGYNAKQHACLACVGKQIQFVSDYESNYPLRLKTVWMVNTPKSFESLLNILKSFMTPETKKGIEIFGHDTSEWKPKLHTVIDPSQLLPIFGGTKIKYYKM